MDVWKLSLVLLLSCDYLLVFYLLDFILNRSVVFDNHWLVGHNKHNFFEYEGWEKEVWLI